MDFQGSPWKHVSMRFRIILSLAFGAVFSAVFFLPVASAASASDKTADTAFEQECLTVDSIAQINRGIIEERFRLVDEQARMFLAADPALLDFPDDFERLTQAPIDEFVVWRHRRLKTIGMAVPFADGCAVEGYGEPDLLEKLEAMRNLVLLISKRGPDSSDVGSALRDLATFRERAVYGQVISTPSQVEERVETLLARILKAQVGFETNTTSEVQGSPAGCIFDDLDVSVAVPQGFSPIATTCPTVGYRKLLGEMHALGFYVQRVPMPNGLSMEYGDVKEFVDGQVSVTQVQFDKSHGARLLKSRRIDNDADYPKAIVDRHGACGQLEVEFRQTVSGREGVERRRGLICLVEMPPSGSKQWAIINVFVFEMNGDPDHIKPAPEFEQLRADIFRSVQVNEPKS